jgi:two-component system, NtrC family, sensor kinase
MTPLMEKLPTLLILGALVATFIALRKHSHSRRVGFWIFAWALILLHFCSEAFKPHLRLAEETQLFVDLLALELSGIVFLVSLTPFARLRWRGAAVLALLALPVSLHAAGVAFGPQTSLALAVAVGAVFLASALAPVFLQCRFSPRILALELTLAGVGLWAVRAQLHGSSGPAVIAIRGLSFGLCGVLYWNSFPRATLGVLTVTTGFLAWGAVFPAAYLLQQFLPRLQVNPDLWNVPKFLVAFGMILALLENQSRIIERAGARERAENALLGQLSRLTSQLLAGKDPAALSGEIAEVITATTGFGAAAILLTNEQGSLRLTGASGYSAAETKALGRLSDCSFLSAVPAAAADARPFGQHSFRVPPGRSLLASAPEKRAGEAAGEGETVIPLLSSRGSYLGCILLSRPQKPVLAASTLTKLEMLAGDLAVTLENTRLHHHLVRSEKLAALGQLVAGVAHELNNPLTAVMGYTELLGDEVKSETARARLEKLGQQARRMKRIVDGLLRFAHQGSPETSAAKLEPVLHDVLELRQDYLGARNIELQVEVEPYLPAVATSADELKQIFLNLLNNAVDAVEESRVRIVRIEAKRQAERVVVRFEDSGPGFTDPNRAFDPFYTTKPVGKGTGLGLSICYGIARKCGGEIHLANQEPYGACVTVELPVANEAACLRDG